MATFMYVVRFGDGTSTWEKTFARKSAAVRYAEKLPLSGPHDWAEVVRVRVDQ